MQIVLKSNFDIAGMLGPTGVELQEGSSVRTLLDRIAQQCHLNLIDPSSGQINAADFTILLNGNEHTFWPQGLATSLRESDEVQILLIPLGGG